MFDVRFTDEALAFLKERDAKEVSILEMSVGGCAGIFAYPTAVIGKPPAYVNYEELEVSGLKVYVFAEADSIPEGTEVFIGSEMRGEPGLEVRGLRFERSPLDQF